MTNWKKKAGELCCLVDKAEIEQMIGFGKLMREMIKLGYRTCRTETALQNKVAQVGCTFPQRYFQKAHLLVTRFTPILLQRMVALSTPRRVALVAVSWAQHIMEERLTQAQFNGWASITEKYVLRKRPDRRNNPKHRANSIHAGLDDNIDLRTIKKNGEIDHDAIVDVLRNLITINPDFERDLREAYQMCGKLVKVA